MRRQQKRCCLRCHKSRNIHSPDIVLPQTLALCRIKPMIRFFIRFMGFILFSADPTFTQKATDSKLTAVVIVDKKQFLVMSISDDNSSFIISN